MGVEFFQTGMGHKFYEGTMPKIAEALKSIGDALTAHAKRVELFDRIDARISALEAGRAGTTDPRFPHGEELAKLEAASHWDEDPEFLVADWKYEVANDDTRQGYAAWVESQRHGVDDPARTPRVECTLCRKRTPAETAHLHQNGWIGECCWDDRLRHSE